MRSKSKRGVPPTLPETSFETKQREHKQAIEIASQFKNIKPTKYLLK